MSRPATRAVTFDAGGTLVEPVEPVGVTYARLARRAGFAVGEAAMEAGFRRAFAAAPALAAPAGSARERRDFERAWWRRIVEASLTHALDEATAGGATRPADEDAARDELFAAAFAHYAAADAWRVYPDAVAVLEELRARGLALAVISNFDARLHRLLEDLGLARFFDALVVSSEVGAAKPERAIFAHALERLGGLGAAACVHVGDSQREDVRGALDAGLRAVWLERAATVPAPRADAAPEAAYPTIVTLAELPRHLYSPA